MSSAMMTSQTLLTVKTTANQMRRVMILSMRMEILLPLPQNHRQRNSADMPLPRAMRSLTMLQSAPITVKTTAKKRFLRI